MCDGSELEDPVFGAYAAGSAGGGGSSSSSSKLVSRRKVAMFPDQFLLIDITEGDESPESADDYKVDLPKMTKVPMGTVIRSAYRKSAEGKALLSSKPKLVFCCQGQSRSQTTSAFFNGLGFDTYALKGGFASFRQAFATDDEWAVVLAYGAENPEKVGLALNLANAGAAKGFTSTLVFMAEAVRLATSKFQAESDFELSETFKPYQSLMANLFSKGGQILCCTSCMKERSLTKDDLIEGVAMMKGPDLVDILMNSKSQLQFT